MPKHIVSSALHVLAKHVTTCYDKTELQLLQLPLKRLIEYKLAAEAKMLHFVSN